MSKKLPGLWLWGKGEKKTAYSIGSRGAVNLRAMRFMQAMEKKKSVNKLQIQEEWFAMGV